MHVRSLLLAGTVAGLALGTSYSPAHAATSATQQAIQAQQAQIDYLKQQLQAMSDKLNQLQVQEAAAPKVAVVPPGPKIVQSANNRFAIESADGEYSAAVTGRIHADVGDYVNYDPKSKYTSPQDLNSGFNLRRARIGVTGKAAGDFTYGFIYDFGGSSDATGQGIQTAQVGYTGIKNMVFELGYSDTFFTLDEATSSNDVLFMERAAPANVATSANAGDFRANIGGRYFNDRLWAGAYILGPSNGQLHTQGESLGAFERIAYQVISEPGYTLHLGGAVDEIINAPLNNGAALSTTSTANLTTGAVTTSNTPAGYTFTLSDRPELRIDPTALLTTGGLGSLSHPVNGGYIADVELAGNYGPLFAQGEYFHYDIQRQGLSDAEFDGGYGEVSYVLTGESHKYNKAAGAYGGIVPAHAFSPSEGYWGAWEIAGRISYVDLTDNFAPGVANSSQPSAINGGKETGYTFGVNWYPNSYMRFMLNYVHTDFDKANSGSSGPLGVPVGATIDAIALRTQVAW